MPEGGHRTRLSESHTIKTSMWLKSAGGRMADRPALMRALRAMLVIPAGFALTYEGFGNVQIALFAAFGGFASLIVASFGGSRRDKLGAHLGLAATGSIALIIGAAVSGIEWLPVLVTSPVGVGIFSA